MTSVDKAADHLMAAAREVRRFGRAGEPAARELETLASVVAGIPREASDFRVEPNDASAEVLR